jgi:outer membrane lipoprotein SlyB
MKLISALIMVLSLTACGTTDSIRNSGDTDYIIISQSKIGGIYGLISGKGSTCKLSKHGVTGLEYTIEFNNGECIVSAAK